MIYQLTPAKRVEESGDVLGKTDVLYGHTCGLVGFSGALLSGVLRSGCWTFTSKVWFFAEDISSPFRAIVPNVCLLSTFSGKERERQRVGNDHRPSLAACCGWKKKKIHSGSKEKKNFVYVAMAFLAMGTAWFKSDKISKKKTQRECPGKLRAKSTKV